MVISFFVAVTVTPWLMLRFGGDPPPHHAKGASSGGTLGRIYTAVARPILATKARAWAFLLAVGVATLASLVLLYTKSVTVKLLPFDNKSELQVVIDLPRGASLEETDRVLQAAAEKLAELPEMTSIQAYAGTAAPFNFNGLVRHSYLRNDPQQGDLQINLSPKSERNRTSHAIALDVRKMLHGLPMPEETVVKVVEVPPGPPVLATLLAEIYADTPEERRAVAGKVREAFRSVPFIVDDDVSYSTQAPRVRLSIDHDKLEFHKVEESDVYNTIQAVFGGVPVGYSHKGGGRHPMEIAVQIPKSDLTIGQPVLTTPVPANALPGERDIVELGDVVRMSNETASFPIFRHNGRPAEMVMAELAGAFEAPVYGMLAVADTIAKMDWGATPKPTIAFSCGMASGR
jgi:multidrug efflux pump subunit AcrB